MLTKLLSKQGRGSIAESHLLSNPEPKVRFAQLTAHLYLFFLLHCRSTVFGNASVFTSENLSLSMFCLYNCLFSDIRIHSCHDVEYMNMAMAIN